MRERHLSGEMTATRRGTIPVLQRELLGRGNCLACSMFPFVEDWMHSPFLPVELAIQGNTLHFVDISWEQEFPVANLLYLCVELVHSEASRSYFRICRQ